MSQCSTTTRESKGLMVVAIMVPPPPGPITFQLFAAGFCAKVAIEAMKSKIAQPAADPISVFAFIYSALAFLNSAQRCLPGCPEISLIMRPMRGHYRRFETRSPNGARSLYLLDHVVYMIPAALGVLSI